DMAWSTHPGLQSLARHDVRRIYFPVLIAFTLFGMWAIRQAQPGLLIIFGAFIAAFNFVVLGAHVLVVQHRFLPADLRMPRIRAAAIALMVWTFTGSTYLGIHSKWPDVVRFFGGRKRMRG